MKDLIRIEEHQLLIADEVVNQIYEFEKAKKQIEEAEKKLKQRLEELMSTGDCGTSYESNDKRIKISYTPSGFTYRLNQTKLQEEEPEIFKKIL